MGFDRSALAAIQRNTKSVRLATAMATPSNSVPTDNAPRGLVVGLGSQRPFASMVFDVPPSANRYWRKTRRGDVYVSEAAQDYKQHVRRMVGHGNPPLTGEVVLRVQWHRKRKQGDLSNRIKVLEDALIGIAYADDKQVRRIEAERFENPSNPRVIVTVEPFVTVEPAAQTPPGRGK